MTIPPIQVQAFGQSIWTDNISRQLIESGELARLVQEGGVVGLTSNPSIFQKAIGETNDYDALIEQHWDNDASTLYELLAIKDIQDAADILKPVYERTQGVDGYVSLEVSPLLANSTEETVHEAKKLFAAVNRPNLMIKIPATKAGIPAIEEVIAAGINVNVTLIFSVGNYEAVADAYIRGLERRHAQGLPVTGIASVASFFVSRIDATVDKMLENNIRAAQARDLDRVSANRKLLSKAAIANAKLAYRSYQRIFEGERFAKLAADGAMVQRPLWASTSTKNPALPDTLYVDALIGKNTVNTLPPATLKAFTDHGTAADTLAKDFNDAAEVLDALSEVGVNFEQVTRQLQVDGVEAFIDSFETLINQVEAKRVTLKTGIIGRQKVALGIYREKVEQALGLLANDHINVRIWNKDATVWKDNPAVMDKIVNRLGWLDIAKTIDIARLKALQTAIHTDANVKHVVLLGMGGSSLAPEVLFKTFGQQDGFPNLLVLDSTHPDQILAVEHAVDLSKTLFIVASKSGGTIETHSFYEYFFAKTNRNGAQFIAITDAGSDLQKIAEQQHFRDIFINPSDIGGRYSAMSYFGLVPAALIGLDLDRLWKSALDMLEACGEMIPAPQHPGLWLGAIMAQLAHEKRDKLMIFSSTGVASFGDWAEQLVAESTGKEDKGILPVVSATVGKPHDYGSDRLFVYLKLEGDASNDELDEAVRILREAGHPRVTLTLPDKYAIGGEFLRWEYATAIAGKMLGINPFDEPNVSEAKKNSGDLLAHYKQHGALPQTQPTLAQNGVALYATEETLAPLRDLCNAHGFDAGSLTDLVAAQILGTEAGDYFAMLVYGAMNDTTTAQLKELQRMLRHNTRRAVTFGYGPRYLHSTGQLHKGGANNGVFFQLTHDFGADVDIPNAGYSFATLNSAQAAGDMKALADHKRRAIRLHAESDSVKPVLEVLFAALDAVAARRQ